MRRGYIGNEYTAWCGRCVNWERVEGSTKGVALLQFRMMGWKNTRKHGWVCPTCMEKEKEKEEKK